MSTSLLAHLNPQQLEAVTLPHGSALVLAGAGSGKTRVLTTRIAWLLATGQASPLSVLAVTFTNKAAREMMLRLSALTPMSVRGMWIGTFHGLCNRMLRAHHRDADLPQLFQIMDTQDQLALVKRMYKAHNLDDDRFPPRQLAWFIAAAKEAGMRPNAVEAGDEFARRQVEHYALYEAMCQREGVVDFAELLLRSYELLARNDAIRNHYQRRFSHLLVDEFQDTNLLQYRWLRLLAGPDAAVFAVGDDDQSIYAFRGANVANMQHYERDFGQGGRGVKLIKLEQNYRSHGNILDAANALIRHNRTRLGKKLWTQRGQGRAGARVRRADRPRRGGVRRRRRQGARPTRACRCPRSRCSTGRTPNRACSSMRSSTRGCPTASGAACASSSAPRSRTRSRTCAWSPRPATTARSCASSISRRAASARARSSSCRTSRAVAGRRLWQAAASGAVGGKAGASLATFVRTIEKLRGETVSLPLPEAVEHVIEGTGLKAHYAGEKDGDDRVENLEELVNAAQGFVREADIASDAPMLSDRVAPDTPVPQDGPAEGASDPLTAFLAHAALEAGETQAAEGRPALQLMTVHSAKGLEFHTVFVTGLEEGLFPHENSMNEADGLEEERRLMYVALTRARRRLYLTHAQSRMLHGQTRYNIAVALPRRDPARTSCSGCRRRARATSIDRRRRGRVGQRSTPRRRRRAAGARVAHRPERAPREVRRRRHRRCRGPRRRRPRAGQFSRAGLKWLALEYAKLEPA